MSLFGKKRVTLVEKQSVTIGEFDITVDGAYRNIMTFRLDVKKGRDVYASVKSDNGVDVSLVDVHGYNSKYQAEVKDSVLGPVHVDETGTMALVLGVFRGDLAHVELECWME